MENKKLIEKAIGFIQSNPKENLSLQSIAENAGFSLTYFDAMFQKHTGYSPVEYSRIYKLTRSALELRRTQKTILEIALDFGYSSPESFTRAFKNFYSITPTEYREKFANDAVTWQDLSGRIAITHFKNNIPELKFFNIEIALDYCFTHNPLKYAEDIINLSMGNAAVMTLDDENSLTGFVCVSDYNQPEPFINIVYDTEEAAIAYVKLLADHNYFKFTLRTPHDEEWHELEAEIATHGLTCTHGYDMIYPLKEIEVPQYPNITVRELTPDDMNAINALKDRGGCAECHVRSLQIAFEKKGNLGERGFALFIDGEMSALSLPILDTVRELRKYDIGAILGIGNGLKNESIELIWKYIINACLQDNATIGNANAKEDDSPIGVTMCEKVGLVKVAKVCKYSK